MSDPLQMSEMECNWLESNLVALSCDLPHDTIVSTIESIDSLLTNFIDAFTNKVLFDKEPIEPTQESAFITHVPKLPTPLTQFLQELKKKTIVNISSYLDDRRSQDQSSLLNFKKRMLDSVTTCRLSAEQYRQTYDIAARHREHATLANVEENNKKKLETEMEKLSKAIHGKEYENSILSKQLQFLMIEREMLENKIHVMAHQYIPPRSGSPKQKKGKKGKHKKPKSRQTLVSSPLFPMPGDILDGSPILEASAAAQECRFCIEHQAKVRNLEQEIKILKWRLDHSPSAAAAEDVPLDLDHLDEQEHEHHHHHHKKHHSHKHHSHKHHPHDHHPSDHHSHENENENGIHAQPTDQESATNHGNQGHSSHGHGHHSHHHPKHKHDHDHDHVATSTKASSDENPTLDENGFNKTSPDQVKINGSSKAPNSTFDSDGSNGIHQTKRVDDKTTLDSHNRASLVPDITQHQNIHVNPLLPKEDGASPSNQGNPQAPGSPSVKAITVAKKGQRSTVAAMGSTASSLFTTPIQAIGANPLTSLNSLTMLDNVDATPITAAPNSSIANILDIVAEDTQVSKLSLGTDETKSTTTIEMSQLQDKVVAIIEPGEAAESVAAEATPVVLAVEIDNLKATDDSLLSGEQNTPLSISIRDVDIVTTTVANDADLSVVLDASPVGGLVDTSAYGAPVVPPPTTKVESRSSSNPISAHPISRAVSGSVKERVQSPAPNNGTNNVVKRTPSLRGSTPTKQPKDIDPPRTASKRNSRDKESEVIVASTIGRLPSNGTIESVGNVTNVSDASSTAHVPVSAVIPSILLASRIEMTDSPGPDTVTATARVISNTLVAETSNLNVLSSPVVVAEISAAVAAATTAAEASSKLLVEEFEKKLQHQSQKLQEKDILIQQQQIEMEELVQKSQQSTIAALEDAISLDSNDSARGSRSSLSIIERENIFKDQLLVEAREVQSELQTRLLSLEYQNAKLSKKLRSEEANQERMEALHRLQVEERDILLKVMSEQIKDLRTKLSRTEELAKISAPPSKPVRENEISRMRALGDISPKRDVCSLPVIKWDTNNGFAQGRMHSRESRRSLSGLESSSTPNLQTAAGAQQQSTIFPTRDVSPPRRVVGGVTAAFKASAATSSGTGTDMVTQAAAVVTKANRRIDAVSILKDNIDKTRNALPAVDQFDLSPASVDLRGEVQQIRQQIASVLVANSAVEKRDPTLAVSRQAETKRKSREVPLKSNPQQ